MTQLQHTFTYSGDPVLIPEKSVKLDFKSPVYEYFVTSDGSNQPIGRRIVSRDNVSLEKTLAAKTYQVSLPESLIVGKNEDKTLLQRFLIQSINLGQIDNFSTTLTVSSSLGDGISLDELTLDAFYFFKVRPSANLTFSRVNNPDFDLNHIILINKIPFANLQKQVLSISSKTTPFSLLQAIAALTNTSIDPYIPEKVSDELRNNLSLLLNSDNAELIDLILKNVPELFDFPIVIPEIKLIELAGIFGVKTNDGSKITPTDLTYYKLFASFNFRAENTAAYREVFVDLSKKDSAIENNSVKFIFPDDTRIVQNMLTGNIAVGVKSFDGALLWSKTYAGDDPVLQNLKIEVPLVRPVILTNGNEPNATDPNKKLRGQVISFSKECPLKGIQVVVQAKRSGAETFSIVGSAKTDNSGNFFMPYPWGTFTAAEATVSSEPDSPVLIPIVTAENKNETIADDFLYLLTDLKCESKEEEDDCDCHSPKKVSRLPDQDDLIKSDEFSQDLGGSCINLSTPNRTLSEYSYQAVVRTSDPDVANYTLRRIKSSDNLTYLTLVNSYLAGTSTKSPIDVRFELIPSAGKITRKPVDLDNPIKWQDDPEDNENLSIYQAVTIATGHILHYRSKFKADGYSLGDLLYSLALAPGQKKQIVVFDSAHSLLGSETQQVSQSEKLIAGIVNDRTITDQLGGNVGEALRGQSNASTSGVSAGGGLGFSYGGFGVSLGVSGGSSSSDSSSSQTSARDVSQFFGEQLRQSIIQNADSYRQLNASVVTTVQENQKYSATTEVVANHNHCHALTILYFEVLRHFAVYQELSSVEECVFVPFLLTHFTIDNIYKWRDVLAPGLLPMPSNTYLSVTGFGGGYQHPLLKGFDANERIKTSYANVDFPAGAYDDELITNVKGTIKLRVIMGKPKTRYDRIKSFPLVTTETDRDGFLGWIADGLFGKGSTTNPQPNMDEYMNVDANFTSVAPKDCVRIIKFDSNFFDKDLVDKTLWTVYARLLTYTTVEEMLENFFKDRLISEWEEIYNSEIAPVVFEKIVQSLNFQPMSLGGIGADFSSATKYHGGETVMEVRFNGNCNLKRNQFDQHIMLASQSPDVVSLNGLVTVIAENIYIYYSTLHYNGILYSGFSGDDLLDGTNLYIPENSDEKRNPRKEDIFVVNKLIEHLNSHLEYYNKLLWYRLDPDRRYMLLDGFNIDLYNDLGVKLPPRSLASVIKNQLITVAGNSLVFPVAAGYKVSNSFVVEMSQERKEVNISLFEHYQPLTPVEPYRISVPSRGVFAETIQSYCNACEKIEADRLQDWNKFPNTDEPTAITPITAPTPTITDWKAAFKDFATPIVNIQNAPASPAPGAGLTGLSELLGKSGIFKDITGLDANQQNALKTYLSNQDNAKAFAEMAKELAMQNHNTDHSEKMVDSMKSAKDGGAISQEDYSKLMKDHLQKQIDGGSKTNDNSVSNESSLSKAAVDAVSSGKDVKATKTDAASGLAETLEVSAPATGAASLPEILIIKLIIPEPKNVSGLKTFDPTADNIGFAAFDKAFDPAKPNNSDIPYDDSSNGLKADFVDNDSNRFFIEVSDSKAEATVNTIQLDWITTFEDGKTPYDLTANSKVSLYRDTTKANTFRSKALILVHEEIDLAVVVDGKKTGEADFRIRLAGMFSKIRLLYNTRSDSDFVFPVFRPGYLKSVPVSIFVLRNSANTPLASPDAVATSIARLQDIYDSQGILFDAKSEYTFKGNSLAQTSPTPSVFKRNIEYKVNEITIPPTINVDDIRLTDAIAIADLIPPTTSKIRIVIIGDFNKPDFPGNLLAFAVNKSYSQGKTVSPNFVNTLYVRATATGAGFPYTIAHEIGHLLMDKYDFLQSGGSKLPAILKFEHHYQSDDAKLPQKQNLMNPSTANKVSVFSTKRIWNAIDADGYNQFKDLHTDRMNLMR